MKSLNNLLFVLFLFLSFQTLAQSEHIYSAEGKIMLNSSLYFENCINLYLIDGKKRDATAICRCQIETINGRFTNKQYKNYTKGRMIDLDGLMQSDPSVMLKLSQCITSIGKSALIKVENDISGYINECKSNLRSYADSVGLAEKNLEDYCKCRASLIADNNYSDKTLEKLSNSNSHLYYYFESECGDFLEKETKQVPNFYEIEGPAFDTLSFYNIRGMSYLNVKLSVFDDLFWMLDTGASDLLINLEMEETLTENNVLNTQNFRGVRDYELANGSIERCRTYLVDDVKIGDYNLKNVSVSVTDKGKKILIGRSLLNKFGTVTLDNNLNKIYLSKFNSRQ